MEDRLFRLLNSNRAINQHIDDYKEAFIEFYGEDMRELIDQQFSKCTFIGQLSPKSINGILNSLYKEKGMELVNESIKESGLNFTYDDLIGYYGSLCNFKNTTINLFHQFYVEHKKGMEERKNEYLISKYNEMLENNPNMSYNDFLVNHPFIVNDRRFEERYNSLYRSVSPLLRKISPDLDVNNIDSVMERDIYQKLDDLFYSIDSKMDSFHQFEESLDSYRQLDESLNKLSLLKSNNSILNLARDTHHLFPEQINKNLESTLDGSLKDYAWEDLFVYIYGRDIRYPSKFDCFSEENEQILNTGKNDWRTESIKENRIKYFNLLGINLGNDYDKYMQDERVKSVFPTKEVRDKFFMARNKYLNSFNNDFFNSIPYNIDIRRKIDSLGLLVKDDAFDASSYNYAAFINPNVRMTDNGIDMHTILIVNCDQFNNALDHYVTHELNHLIELSLEKETADKYSFLCGWDVVEIDKSTDENKEVDSLSKRENKRKYELFNEIINEKLAQEVSTIMYNHDKHIFNDKNNCIIRNASSYEAYSFLVNDFYDRYKQDIIQSRHNGNIGIIYDAVGYDNFDQLNNLCNEFGESFPGMDYYQLRDDLIHKNSTGKTKKYFELCRKRDAIMMSIDSYRQDKGIKTLEEQASK